MVLILWCTADVYFNDGRLLRRLRCVLSVLIIYFNNLCWLVIFLLHVVQLYKWTGPFTSRCLSSFIQVLRRNIQRNSQENIYIHIDTCCRVNSKSFKMFAIYWFLHWLKYFCVLKLYCANFYFYCYILRTKSSEQGELMW